MKRPRLGQRTFVFTVIALLITVGAGVAAMATPEQRPPQPPPVQEGSVEDLPERVPALNQEGEVVGHIKRDDLAGTNDPSGDSNHRVEERRIPVRSNSGEVVGFMTSDGFQPRGGS